MARATALVAALLLLAWAPEAGAIAARRTWRTVLTPHFRVHFHEGLAPLAQHVAHVAEDALEGLSERLAHLPEDPIHVVLSDETDTPNGFASVLPENVITLFASVPPPESALGEFDDYWRLLVTHELAHVVHLDTIGGAPAVVNAIVGKQLAPNQVQPRWMIEGLATWLESELTGAGRVRSGVFDAIVRAQALERTLPAIDELSSGTRRFPGGISPYVYGSRFLAYLAGRFGSDAIAELSHRYGARLVPYAMNVVARDTFGRDLPTLWEEWQAEEGARARAHRREVELEGPSPRFCLDGLAPELRALRVGRDGTIALVESPRDDDTVLSFRRPGEPPFLAVRTSAGEGAFTSDGRYLAVIEDVAERRFRYRDLELIDLASGARRRRTEGARLSEPDVREGRVVAVETRGGATAIVTLSLDGDDGPRVLASGALGAGQLSSPRWSPDGRSVAAVLRGADGSRSIVELDAATGAIRRRTETGALDHAPSFTPDGRRILFASDRSGALELYAIEREDGAIARLTASITAAWAPAIDEQSGRVYYLSATGSGAVLCSAALEELPPRPAAEGRPPAAPAHAAPLVRYEEEPYAPWETLLPKTIQASVAFASGGELAASLELRGEDATSRHEWALSLGYDGEVRRLGYDLSYSCRVARTPISVRSFLDTNARPGAFAAADRRIDQLQSAWSLRLGIELPLPAWDFYASFYANYGFELRRPLVGVPADPFQRAPRGPGPLVLSPLTGGWRISSTRGFAESISSARGAAFDVSASVHHPSLGSSFELVDLSAHLYGFLPLPTGAGHVLALRASGSVALGLDASPVSYALGGLGARNVLLDAIEGASVGPDVLRGYAQAARRGPARYLVTAEFRLPFIDVEAGVETLPAFADRLHLAIFTDVGDTPRAAPSLADAGVGVGAEARLDLVFGYFVPIRVRFGYARGLTEDGIDDVFLVLGGVF